MLFKVSVLVFFVQAVVVLSQHYPQQQQQPGMTQAEMWNPYTWMAPYQTQGSNSWVDYLQKAQEISSQFYKEWEKAGAGDMFATGMKYAQQAAKEAQKGAEGLMNQPFMKG